MRRLLPTLLLGLGTSLASQAQLYIDNATFFIESGATVTVQGDLTSNTSIQGPGKILLKGTALQNVNMNNGGAATNAYTIPNLEIDNAANVALTGNVKVGTALTFTNGKVQLGNYNFVLANAATATGAGTSKFLETTGTGFAQREIGNAAAATPLVIPVGTGTTYTPISLSHTGGTYANAVLGAQSKAGRSPNSPIRTETYSNNYWPVATTGVTGGTLVGTGTYNDFTTASTGVESDIRGMSFNGTDWSMTGGAQNDATNLVTGSLAATSGQIFGQNRFLLMNSKVLLQGASPTAGVMLDGLRTAPNVIPTTEPYRSAPYSFTSVNGGTQEVAAASVFADAAITNNNIVDWVFVELRAGGTNGTATPAPTVIQTRSAFVQKDGDIVDIDGVTPLYFKNLDAGTSYTVTVKHRNHLAISTNNADANSFYKTLTMSGSTTPLDFSTLPTNSILGTANSNYFNASGFNMMYAGNTNNNTTIRWNPSNSDKDFILSSPLILNGVSSTVLTNVYNVGDVNMDKRVRWNPSASDKDFILSTPLAGNSASVKTQVLPN